ARALSRVRTFAALLRRAMPSVLSAALGGHHATSSWVDRCCPSLFVSAGSLHPRSRHCVVGGLDRRPLSGSPLGSVLPYQRCVLDPVSHMLVVQHGGVSNVFWVR